MKKQTLLITSQDEIKIHEYAGLRSYTKEIRENKVTVIKIQSHNTLATQADDSSAQVVDPGSDAVFFLGHPLLLHDDTVVLSSRSNSCDSSWSELSSRITCRRSSTSLQILSTLTWVRKVTRTSQLTFPPPRGTPFQRLHQQDGICQKCCGFIIITIGTHPRMTPTVIINISNGNDGASPLCHSLPACMLLGTDISHSIFHTAPKLRRNEQKQAPLSINNSLTGPLSRNNSSEILATSVFS